VRAPTIEQDGVLASGARVRIVHAVPGSGKTWLVAELIRRETENWPNNTNGIAALSFTRVGGREICSALGHETGHPHFVGTLDAFLFRFVVRPFLKKVYGSFALPRLIPADWSPARWAKRPDASGWEFVGSATPPAKPRSYNVLGTTFVGSDADGPILAAPRHNSTDQVASHDRRGLLAAKRLVWQRYGWVTHSDVAYLASRLLRHDTHGPSIRRVIASRFPLIVVDELQDTGYFLADCILSLLSEPSVRGVLVGDPDQAIFEFNGARPDLFAKFEQIDGSTALPLSRSHRCPPSVAKVADCLKSTAGKITPSDGVGFTHIITYANMIDDVEKVIQHVWRHNPSGIIKVIARNNDTVDQLGRRGSKPTPRLGCQPLTHMLFAVISFRQSRVVKALASALACIDLAVFLHEGVSEGELREAGLQPDNWKATAVRCLLLANAQPVTGDLYDWQTRVGVVLQQELSAITLGPSVNLVTPTLKPRKLPEHDKSCSTWIPQGGVERTAASPVPISSVHSVKGETHDLTIMVCPPATANRCPSGTWWSDTDADKEERRIAYVAVTRTRGDLILCVSADTLGRLKSQRPEFLACFQEATVTDFIKDKAAPVT
jgi:DNA helicase II / ATP-dependent DNA helicase PcrA